MHQALHLEKWLGGDTYVAWTATVRSFSYEESINSPLVNLIITNVKRSEMAVHSQLKIAVCVCVFHVHHLCTVS